MRTILAATAAVLAILAAAASAIAGDSDLIAFFVVLAAVATIIAALASGRWVGPPRNIARVLALGWVGTAIWIAGLLVIYQGACGCSRPEPALVPPNVLGIPSTLFHLVATYVGGSLVVGAAFGRLGRERAAISQSNTPPPDPSQVR